MNAEDEENMTPEEIVIESFSTNFGQSVEGVSLKVQGKKVKWPPKNGVR